jgi:hypothetical protein
VAEEAAVTAETMGNRVLRIADVGVAGLHRLLRRLPEIQGANVVIVAAGMDPGSHRPSMSRIAFAANLTGHIESDETPRRSSSVHSQAAGRQGAGAPSPGSPRASRTSAFAA